MKHSRIKSTVSFIVECLAAKNYTLLRQLDYSQEIPAGYVEHTIAEFGGEVTVVPAEQLYRIDVVRHSDIKDKLFVDIKLWLDNRESDVTLQCTFHTGELLNGLYRFSVTDLDVL